jgi:hypothetical protein
MFQSPSISCVLVTPCRGNDGVRWCSNERWCSVLLKKVARLVLKKKVARLCCSGYVGGLSSGRYCLEKYLELAIPCMQCFLCSLRMVPPKKIVVFGWEESGRYIWVHPCVCVILFSPFNCYVCFIIPIILF